MDNPISLKTLFEKTKIVKTKKIGIHSNIFLLNSDSLNLRRLNLNNTRVKTTPLKNKAENSKNNLNKNIYAILLNAIDFC